jgi:hypothetical protein
VHSSGAHRHANQVLFVPSGLEGMLFEDQAGIDESISSQGSVQRAVSHDVNWDQLRNKPTPSQDSLLHEGTNTKKPTPAVSFDYTMKFAMIWFPHW